MNFDIRAFERRDIYRFLTSAVVPRPIAWVSTVDLEGNTNLAPFSFFTVACCDPPVLSITVSDRRSGPKDTYENIRQTRCFVVNIVEEGFADAVHRSSRELPHGHSEFALAGVTAAPSHRVAAPRVAEAVASFECRWLHTVTFGVPNSHVVFGEVVWAHVRDDVLAPDERPVLDPERWRPLARLGGRYYGRDLEIYAASDEGFAPTG